MEHPENILALIEKYLAGTITPAERDYLNQWYHSFNDDEVEVTLDDNENEEQLFEKIRSRLLETIHQDEGQQKNLRSNRKWRVPAAAAIAVLILLSAAYWMFSSKPSKQEITTTLPETKSENDIAPGGNRAVLTLADGSPVILDSVSNGIIGHQGNTKVQKLNNGLLVYVINGRQVSENDEAFYNKITTPRGGQYQVTFTDGTKVWLNAASSIRFPVVFTGKYRKVEITGEAYFEVVKNKTMPFKVKANNSEIEVLGTHFNVSAYNDEAEIKTTLLEGKVKVSALDSDNKSPAVLKPGEQAAINKEGKIDIKNNADTEEAMAWMNGYFQFKSADLKTILRQIARWYDVDIEYKGNANMLFTGQLTRNENVSKVLDKLALTGEVHFKIDGKKIIVSPQK
jgi:ferric-dicitrate binding protein FerR (iron transport regulator)